MAMVGEVKEEAHDIYGSRDEGSPLETLKEKKL